MVDGHRSQHAPDAVPQEAEGVVEQPGQVRFGVWLDGAEDGGDRAVEAWGEDQRPCQADAHRDGCTQPGDPASVDEQAQGHRGHEQVVRRLGQGQQQAGGQQPEGIAGSGASEPRRHADGQQYPAEGHRVVSESCSLDQQRWEEGESGDGPLPPVCNPDCDQCQAKVGGECSQAAGPQLPHGRGPDGAQRRHGRGDG